ncbi:MAG: HEPN domain-containing protein [Anaerolineae bacterium]
MRRNPDEEAQRWLTHAEDEFLDAEELRQRGRFYLALFHFQQAAEKALKAYLYWTIPSAEVFLTHSIYELIQQAKKIDADFERVEKASKLDQYYIPTRYPNGLPGGVPSRFYTDPDEACQAMELARAVIELVKLKLKGTGEEI